MLKDTDFKKIITQVYNSRFNYDDPLPERPEYLIEIEQEGERYGIALPGSVIEISGRPKARKSSLMAGFVAACLSEGRKVMNIESKIKGNILWIDTEQSKIEFSYFQKMLINMAGLKRQPENYIALNIRKFDDVQRFLITDHFIDRIPDLGLIVLDGIADLSIDENEQTSTKSLVSKVMAWADIRKCPLMVAIHTNKDGKESTGHLGGYLDKRCSYHIRVEKATDDSPSKVYAKLSRMGEKFETFMFEHQLGGLPNLVAPTPIGDESEVIDMRPLPSFMK